MGLINLGSFTTLETRSLHTTLLRSNDLLSDRYVVIKQLILRRISVLHTKPMMIPRPQQPLDEIISHIRLLRRAVQALPQITTIWICSVGILVLFHSSIMWSGRVFMLMYYSYVHGLFASSTDQALFALVSMIGKSTYIKILGYQPMVSSYTSPLTK